MRFAPCGRSGIRASGIYAPLLVSDPHSSQRKTVPEEVLTISGADRFTRRGGTCRLHAIFMNQLCNIWGEQDELSSTAACPRAEGIYSINDQARMRGIAVLRRSATSSTERDTAVSRQRRSRRAARLGQFSSPCAPFFDNLARLCLRLTNRCSLRHSSRRRPLKLSTKPFAPHGPGRPARRHLGVSVPCKIVCSMSRSGNVWDNTAMESFFSSLEAERTARKTYRTGEKPKLTCSATFADVRTGRASGVRKHLPDHVGCCKQGC